MVCMFGVAVLCFIVNSPNCLLIFLYKDTLNNSSQAYKRLTVNVVSIVGYLELDEPECFEASSIPKDKTA